jgi:hypothetical protein
MPRRARTTKKSRQAGVRQAHARAPSPVAPADIGRILAGGGGERIALLRYCVLSVTMEPVFVFLAGEYRLRPTHAAALALYDVFCSHQAPAKVRGTPDLLPPRNLKLAAAIQLTRAQHSAVRPPEQRSGEAPRVPSTVPYRHLFDPLADTLQADPSGHVQRVRLRYNPALTPVQNLPGGRMTAAQRHFVENIWRPVARPCLVAAGFWQIATIG